MIREERTEVLVVGAGPVGLLSALLLAERGIQVRIIDREEGHAAHGYVCALHRNALRAMEQVGLGSEAIELGRPLETVAFYEGLTRRAAVQVRAQPGGLPYVVTLPQRELEDLLEQALLRRARVQVQWSHRLAGLREEGDDVIAEVHELGVTSSGYSVPHLEHMVQRTRHVRASFVIGADGADSLVRQLLDIRSDRLGPSSLYAFYDFEHAGQLADEVRVILDPATTSCLWPLPGQVGRWTFQLSEADPMPEDQAKDRVGAAMAEADDPSAARQSLSQLLRERAPWFDQRVTRVLWDRSVRFENRLVQQFGRGRCWLAGGAGHQACPIGMQSVNVGLREAAQLSGILADILREDAPVGSLEAYNKSRQLEWRQLLGFDGGPRPRPQVDPWVRQRSARFLPCLPASPDDLSSWTDQLDLEPPPVRD